MLFLDVEWCLQVQQSLWQIETFSPANTILLDDNSIYQQYINTMKSLMGQEDLLEKEQILVELASEPQAIEEENIFRKELADIQGKPPTKRFWKTGVLVSSVDNVFVISEWYGPTVPRLPEPIIPAEDVFSSGVVLQPRELQLHRQEK